MSETASGRFSPARNCLKQFQAVAGSFEQCRARSGGFRHFSGVAQSCPTLPECPTLSETAGNCFE
eukprot:12636203-Alexandrium_andersonii.AAC.1